MVISIPACRAHPAPQEATTFGGLHVWWIVWSAAMHYNYRPYPNGILACIAQNAKHNKARKLTGLT